MVIPTIMTHHAENSSFDIPSPELNSHEIQEKFNYLNDNRPVKML